MSMQHLQYSPVSLTEENLQQALTRYQLVTVRVTMPHLDRYGKPVTQELTYAAALSHGTLSVGDRVLCPPTRLNTAWSRGTVTAVFDQDRMPSYRGRLKFVKPLPRKKTRNAAR